jgi:hypothetical protein
MDEKMNPTYMGDLLADLGKLVERYYVLLSEENQVDHWLNSAETADLLRVSRRTLLEYRSKGLIPFSRIGGKLFYKRSDLLKMLNATNNAA